jgi:hypothetical protein
LHFSAAFDRLGASARKKRRAGNSPLERYPNPSSSLRIALDAECMRRNEEASKDSVDQLGSWYSF